MFTESFKNASHFVKFTLVLFTILIGFVIFMVLSAIIAVLIFDVDIKNLATAFDPTKPENLNFVRISQSLYSILSFGLPPILAAWILGGKAGKYLHLEKSPGYLFTVLAAGTILVAFPFINFLSELNKSIPFPEFMSSIENLMKEMENDGQKATKAFLITDSITGYLSNLAILAIIPAVTEELLFRGVFQRIFHEWFKNIHIAIWISAFFFSAMHMQFYGLIPRMVLGAFLGYLFYWSGSLWLPIIAHFLNNAFAVTAFYINGNIAQEAETIGTGDGATLQVTISILLVSVIIYSFYRISKEKNLKLELSNINDESNEQNS